MRRGLVGWLCGLGSCSAAAGGGSATTSRLPPYRRSRRASGARGRYSVGGPVSTADARDRAGGSVDWDWRSLTLPDLPNHACGADADRLHAGPCCLALDPVATDQGTPRNRVHRTPAAEPPKRPALFFRSSSIPESGARSSASRSVRAPRWICGARSVRMLRLSWESSVSARVELSLGATRRRPLAWCRRAIPPASWCSAPAPSRSQPTRSILRPWAQDDRQTIQKDLRDRLAEAV